MLYVIFYFVLLNLFFKLIFHKINKLKVSCVNKKSSYPIEQLNQNEIEKGSDFVFLLLPCDRTKYSLDFTKLAKFFGSKGIKVRISKAMSK